ncbi:uncharacterized protein LOC129743281 [Uranotaenia lowii]|uniref:uncharacterized protein LOC129743281 n=1 Tax=Uranotaenia lowii TaxID=190385 RepID=UPI002478BDB8|nr:uncharacterized protein LOC129743281 [Uranotaenia lowii]
MLLLALLVALIAVVPSKADLSQVCIGVNAGIFPHPDPTQCHLYVSCIFERYLVYQCEAGLIFDAISLECVPGNQEECGIGEVDPRCLQVSFGVFEYAADCGKFVFCQLRRSTEFECLNREIWSQEEGVCIPGNRVTCQPGDVLCMGRPNGLIPYPDDCSRYVACFGELATYRSCPRGYIFSDEQSQCVVGSASTCQSSESVCQFYPDRKHPHPDQCDIYLEHNK